MQRKLVIAWASWTELIEEGALLSHVTITSMCIENCQMYSDIALYRYVGLYS